MPRPISALIPVAFLLTACLGHSPTPGAVSLVAADSAGNESGRVAGGLAGGPSLDTGAHPVSGAQEIAIAGSPTQWTERATKGFAAVKISLRWPERQVAYLPLKTRSVVLTLRGADGNPVVPSSTLQRSPGQAVATATFDHIPAGPTTIVATAKDAGNQVVATGQITTNLAPNQVNAIGLELISTRLPTISGLSPAVGGAGTVITLTGSNLPLYDVTARYSVLVGGTGVPAANLMLGDAGTFYVTLPAGANSGRITLQADGASTQSAEVFTVVANLALTPTASVSLSPGGTQSFAVLATDPSGTAVPGAAISWQMTHLVGLTQGYVDGNPVSTQLATLTPRSSITSGSGQAAMILTALATGSGWLEASCGADLVATTSITVD